MQSSSNTSEPEPKKRREGPMDFILNFVRWQEQNPERKLTAKGFAIVRELERTQQTKSKTTS